MRGLLCVCLLSAAAAAQEQRTEPLTGLALVAQSGLEARADGTTVRWQKAGDERRMLALGCRVGALAWAKAVEVQGSLTGFPATRAKLAVLVWDSAGGSWFRVGSAPPATDGVARVSLSGLQPTAFSAAPQPDLAKVDRLWVALVLDGPGEGVWTVRRAALTTAPVVRTEPLPIPVLQPEAWNVGKDPAVRHKHSVAKEGAGGESVLRLDLTFPETRHLFLVPTIGVPGEDFEGLGKLRVRYKAVLPAGVTLIVALQEPGAGQYIVDPPPAANGQWATLDIPLARLKLAGWSKDDNQRLDVAPGLGLQIGCHGQARPAGDGTIWVAEAALVP
jgi:hypothetical protein